MTAEQIFIDFRKAMALADELDHIARDMQDATDSEYQPAVDSMRQDWTGDNAEEYYEKCRHLRDKMYAGSDNVYKVAHSLRTIAQRWYETEMANLERARRRHHC
jgi:uncharacterized protein YukE